MASRMMNSRVAHNLSAEKLGELRIKHAQAQCLLGFRDGALDAGLSPGYVPRVRACAPGHLGARVITLPSPPANRGRSCSMGSHKEQEVKRPTITYTLAPHRHYTPALVRSHHRHRARHHVTSLVTSLFTSLFTSHSAEFSPRLLFICSPHIVRSPLFGAP